MKLIFQLPSHNSYDTEREGIAVPIVRWVLVVHSGRPGRPQATARPVLTFNGRVVKIDSYSHLVGFLDFNSLGNSRFSIRPTKRVKVFLQRGQQQPGVVRK